MSSKVDEEELLSQQESKLETAEKEEILMRDIEFENLNAE